MNLLLIVVPIAILAFFVGFYLQLLIKIQVDILGFLQKLYNRQDTAIQQEQLNKQVQTGTTFVEPQSLAEIEADEEMERIKALNNQ